MMAFICGVICGLVGAIALLCWALIADHDRNSGG